MLAPTCCRLRGVSTLNSDTIIFRSIDAYFFSGHFAIDYPPFSSQEDGQELNQNESGPGYQNLTRKKTAD
jgi:hypothetical protein